MLKFFRNTSGNFALWFALASVPLFGIAGLAIDYTRMSQVQTRLQNAADAATLSAVIEFKNTSGSTAELEALALKYFKANYDGEYDAKSLVANANTSGDVNVKLNVTANIDTTLLDTAGSLIGKDFSTLKPETISEAGIGVANLAIALAVDTTGSMAQTGSGKNDTATKMDVLKEVAKDFVEDIFPIGSAHQNKVKFSLIPFTDSVRIDNNFWHWNFIKITSPTTNLPNYTVPHTYVWEGCVWDRAASYDNTDATPQTKAERYQNLPNGHRAYNYCPSQQKVIPLTGQRNTILSGVKALTPSGATNTNLGMVWAMNTLKTSSPYKQISTVPNPKKIIIFLTDGENTSSRIMTEGGTREDVDKAMEETCTNAKSDDIEIFTIRLIEGNVSTLKKCASSHSHFYAAKSASDLVGIFDDITQKIWTSAIALKQ